MLLTIRTGSAVIVVQKLFFVRRLDIKLEFQTGLRDRSFVGSLITTTLLQRIILYINFYVVGDVRSRLREPVSFQSFPSGPT